MVECLYFWMGAGSDEGSLFGSRCRVSPNAVSRGQGEADGGYRGTTRCFVLQRVADHPPSHDQLPFAEPLRRGGPLALHDDWVAAFSACLRVVSMAVITVSRGLCCATSTPSRRSGGGDSWHRP